MLYDVPQKTAEWHSLRLGKVTGSRVADVVGKTKDGKKYLSGRTNYMSELLCERLTGVITNKYITREMQWGIDNEDAARTLYAQRHGHEVRQIGFAGHPFFVQAGASPDGLIGSEGMVQIKCPITSNHIETVLSETVPEEYLPQIQWELACTGRSWSDFVSFDPRLPDHLCLFTKRVIRNNNYINFLETEVGMFLAELDNRTNMLMAKKPC